MAAKDEGAHVALGITQKLDHNSIHPGIIFIAEITYRWLESEAQATAMAIAVAQADASIFNTHIIGGGKLLTIVASHLGLGLMFAQRRRAEHALRLAGESCHTPA